MRGAPANLTPFDFAIAIERLRIAELHRALTAGRATVLVAQQQSAQAVDVVRTATLNVDTTKLLASLAVLEAARRQHVEQVKALLRLQYLGEDRRATPRGIEPDATSGSTAT